MLISKDLGNTAASPVSSNQCSSTICIPQAAHHYQMPRQSDERLRVGDCNMAGLVGWCSCSWAVPSADSQLNGHATVAAAAACDTKSLAQNRGGTPGGGGECRTSQVLMSSVWPNTWTSSGLWPDHDCTPVWPMFAATDNTKNTKKKKTIEVEFMLSCSHTLSLAPWIYINKLGALKQE